MMNPKTLMDPWIVNQGSSFYSHYGCYDDDGNPLSFAGYSAFGQVRTSHDAEDAVITMTVENGMLLLIDGVLVVHLLPVNTKNLDAETDYVYDIELVVPGGDRFRVSEGPLVVRPEVSKEG